MWVARRDCDVGELASALESARNAGVANLEGIAAQEAAVVGLSKDECHRYLRDNLHFYLGESERAGLELFSRHASCSVLESTT